MKSLQILKVQYHGGSLEGNHCRRLFKEDALHKITLDVRTGIVASSLDADDKTAALEFLRHLLISSKKYCEVHALLSRCGPIFSQEHQEISTKINDYISSYIETSSYLHHPQNITPKLHILKVHVPEFLKINPIGFGLIDENGNEALHKENKNIFEQICKPMHRDQMQKLLEQSILIRLHKS